MFFQRDVSRHHPCQRNPDRKRNPQERTAGIRAKRIWDGSWMERLGGGGGGLVWVLKSGPGRIEWVGPTSELPKRFRKLRALNLRGKKALIPGLVDCHTHLLFAGDRSDEFAARCGGRDLPGDRGQGRRGIVSTVVPPARPRPRSSSAWARRGCARRSTYGRAGRLEIKSGYGLSMESELKLLEVIPRLRKRFPDMRLTATFLGAHDFPRDRKREEYLRGDHLDEMLPESRAPQARRLLRYLSCRRGLLLARGGPARARARAQARSQDQGARGRAGGHGFGERSRSSWARLSADLHLLQGLRELEDRGARSVSRPWRSLLPLAPRFTSQGRAPRRHASWAGGGNACVAALDGLQSGDLRRPLSLPTSSPRSPRSTWA